jgi:hypothetical protein
MEIGREKEVTVTNTSMIPFFYLLSINIELKKLPVKEGKVSLLY